MSIEEVLVTLLPLAIWGLCLEAILGPWASATPPSMPVPPFPHLEDASETSRPVGPCQGVMS